MSLSKVDTGFSLLGFQLDWRYQIKLFSCSKSYSVMVFGRQLYFKVSVLIYILLRCSLCIFFEHVFSILLVKKLCWYVDKSSVEAFLSCFLFLTLVSFGICLTGNNIRLAHLILNVKSIKILTYQLACFKR